MKNQDQSALENIYGKIIEEQRKNLSEDFEDEDYRDYADDDRSTPNSTEHNGSDAYEMDVNGVWYVAEYDYQRTDIHDSGSYDEPPSTDTEVAVQIHNVYKMDGEDKQIPVPIEGNEQLYRDFQERIEDHIYNYEF
jgi:hypothetical protein